MSWGGYIPGHIVREMVEREEYAVWSELDKQDLQDEFEQIIKEQIYVYTYGGCGCTETELEDVDDAARKIVKRVDELLKPKAQDVKAD